MLFIMIQIKIPSSCEKGISIIAKCFYSCPRHIYHTLISTSTPEGSSNFIRASTVLEDEE